MTPKEIVYAQIAHRQTHYIPYEILLESGTSVVARLNAYFGTPAWQNALTQHIVRFKAIDDGLDWELITEEPFTVDKYGSIWRTNVWQRYLVEPALKSPTLDGYEWPETSVFFTPECRAKVQQILNNSTDAFTAAGFDFGLFERSWTLRGFENGLMDSVAEPAFFRQLIDRIFTQQMEILEELVTLPIDGIMFSDDWGGQQGILLGPERWRAYLKEPMRRMYQFAHSHGKTVLHHTCGNVIDVIPDAIEIGLDVLESVQPEAMNPYVLKRRFGEHLTFWGGLGTQRMVPFGTPDELRAEINCLCREMGRGGGYILAPAKPLQDDTPTENGVVIVEAFLEQAETPLKL
ncbi:MAG: uroporphyrinogen decarboxylase family protein [Spirochaetota bacterium]